MTMPHQHVSVRSLLTAVSRCKHRVRTAGYEVLSGSVHPEQAAQQVLWLTKP